MLILPDFFYNWYISNFSHILRFSFSKSIFVLFWNPILVSYKIKNKTGFINIWLGFTFKRAYLESISIFYELWIRKTFISLTMEKEQISLRKTWLKHSCNSSTRILSRSVTQIVLKKSVQGHWKKKVNKYMINHSKSIK